MRIEATAHMTPQMPDYASPAISIEQVPARRATSAVLVLLLCLAAALLSPFYLIATTALAEETLGHAFTERPLALAQMLTGLALWLVLLGFPIIRLIDTLTRSRRIEIADGRVAVTDRGFGRSSHWVATLSEFAGVACYLRASLSGVRHELILVHPERKRSLLVAMAPRLIQSEVDQISAALAVKEVPPQAVRSGVRGRA